MAKVIEDIRAALENDPHLVGLFLGGSFAKGEADSYSDIDFVAVIEQEDQAAFVAAWQRTLEAIMPLVFWNEVRTRGLVLNAIGEKWERVDVVVTSREAFGKRSRDAVKPLIDRQQLYEGLSATISRLRRRLSSPRAQASAKVGYRMASGFRGRHVGVP